MGKDIVDHKMRLEFRSRGALMEMASSSVFSCRRQGGDELSGVKDGHRHLRGTGKGIRAEHDAAEVHRFGNRCGLAYKIRGNYNLLLVHRPSLCGLCVSWQVTMRERMSYRPQLALPAKQRSYIRFACLLVGVPPV